MHRRDLLLMFAVAAVALPVWLLAKAEETKVTKTDEEWRRLLAQLSIRCFGMRPRNLRASQGCLRLRWVRTACF